MARATFGARLSRFVTAVVLLWFLPGFVKAFPNLWPEKAAWFLPVAVGVALGVVVDRLLVRRVPVLEVFEHELTHLLAGLLFLRIPVGFAASGVLSACAAGPRRVSADELTSVLHGPTETKRAATPLAISGDRAYVEVWEMASSGSDREVVWAPASDLPPNVRALFDRR